MLTSFLTRRLTIMAGAAVLLLAVVSLVPAAAGAASTQTGLRTRYAKYEPVCAVSNPAIRHCLALRRVEVAKETPGARAYTLRTGRTAGPAGGLTPADLAKAYGFNPHAETSVTVATVLWYDDPNALDDLNTFDEKYGLPAETATSFQKVNQNGTQTSYPTADSDAAGEESLDIETIRGVCHKCKIILVEANSYNNGDLTAAENTAVRLGATVVSNSWGGSETSPPSKALEKSFVHPGVAFFASSGDAGWYDWDYVNSKDDDPSERQRAEFPASDPNVISVGGTTLTLTASGTRKAETVWNNNGPADQGNDSGATGGGCSTLFAAPAWQTHVAGWSGTHCGTKRSSNDIAADADPNTGFDVYDTYGVDSSEYWSTVGGTSLASPLLAAMMGLAGGPQGVTVPASTLYANAAHHAATLYDVTSGGNGLCSNIAVATCSATIKKNFSKSNPNLLGYGLLDCSFPKSGKTLPKVKNNSCNAAKGFDGPSGVGTPKGLGVFTPYAPVPTISLARATAAKSKRVATLTVSPNSVPGAKVTKASWSFGDGTTATVLGSSTRHTYPRAGTYTVSVKVVDSQGLTSSRRSRTLTVR